MMNNLKWMQNARVCDNFRDSTQKFVFLDLSSDILFVLAISIVWLTNIVKKIKFILYKNDSLRMLDFGRHSPNFHIRFYFPFVLSCRNLHFREKKHKTHLTNACSLANGMCCMLLAPKQLKWLTNTLIAQRKV